MDSIKQFFSYMNDVDFPYVVLRNWDGLPYDVALGEHSDLDLLVYDFDHWKEIFPQAVAEYPYPRVRMKVPIDDSYIYCDIRHVGDDYYPEDFEKAILEQREWNQKGFYTPNCNLHGIALAYHAVHHKNYVAPEYVRYLGNTSVDELLESFKKSDIGWVAPKDSSVGSYHAYWKGATSVVHKEDGKVRKEQVSYNSYNLIQNEYQILSRVSSRHFPQAYEHGEKFIVIDDCGVPLLDAVPEDWRSQLQEILNDLKAYKILHRDIKLDNLMVKDGVVKLIDFGWAKFEGEDESKEPPSCLGFPNKPSWGFDDAFSMRSVMRQIEFMLEEKGVAV